MHSCAATSAGFRRTFDHLTARQRVLKFGIIAEGPTDQTVIENILLGYFEDQVDDLAINHVQPPRPLTETPGGWGHVFKCLEQKRHEECFNSMIIL